MTTSRASQIRKATVMPSQVVFLIDHDHLKLTLLPSHAWMTPSWLRDASSLACGC